MKIENFIVQIKNGKIEFKSDSHRRLFQGYLNQFEGEYELSIQTKKSKRSDQQHKYYFLYLGLVSESTGFTKDELHEWAKSKFLTENIKEIFGNKTRVRKSTTELTKGEFIEYLMNIEREVEIPLPNTIEYFGFSYHK